MAESVVILLSTYNGKKYIKEQLDSIFNQVVPALNKLVQDVLQDKMYLFLPAGYVGYYILGYYLCKNRLTDKQKNTILVAGIFGAAYAIIGGILYSQYTGGPSQATYNNLTLNIACNGVQREHNKKLNNGLPILHKVPPKRDYGRYFCIMAEKGGTSHGGLTEKLSLFFHAKKQEVNAYGR